MEGRIHSKVGWMLAIGLVFLAGVEFSMRGPVRFAEAGNFNDFVSPYVQTRLWMKGLDPYSPENLVEFWPTEGGRPDFLARDLAEGSLVMKTGMPTAYPATCFLLLAPVAMLPWQIAQPTWIAISLVAYALTVLPLASVMKLQWCEKRTYLYLTMALALAPFQTGLATGALQSSRLPPVLSLYGPQTVIGTCLQAS